MDEREREIREMWRPEQMAPGLPDEQIDRFDVARKDIAYLLARLDEEKRETERLGRAYVMFTQEIDEAVYPEGFSGGHDHIEIASRVVQVIANHTALHDQVARLQTLATSLERDAKRYEDERAALQAQVGQMREALELLWPRAQDDKSAVDNELRVGTDPPDMEWEQIEVKVEAALSSSPPPQWEAAMKVIEAAESLADCDEVHQFVRDDEAYTEHGERHLRELQDALVAWAALGTDSEGSRKPTTSGSGTDEGVKG